MPFGLEMVKVFKDGNFFDVSQSSRPLLDRAAERADIASFSRDELKALAHEVREELIEVVSQTGGHLGAGLGVVELTVALHATFDLPDDILIWDVGHQAYPHKMLTGRRERMTSLRQKDGLSGFTKRSESAYDPFGAGHSSTSISAALGFAEARDALGQDHHVVAVIGDGAMSAGMAYEAMNNAGALKSRMIVILNDNDMSIAPPTGAMRSHLARIVSGDAYRSFRGAARSVAERLPKGLYEKAEKAEEFMRGFWTGGTLFEELGFYYVGPIDGHNLDQLLPILKNAKEAGEGPILVHVVTEKGKGYKHAEESADKYHGVSKFDVKTGVLKKGSGGAPSYTSVFANTLIDVAKGDEKVVAITAAMPSGTGLDKFEAAFPERCYDVGIAEQHAVTFAAGLAAAGLKPFCAIYSTFLQRGYDQLVHDVAVQNLPVRFAIDRAGLVGADGATHAGSFDVAYLCPLPNMVVMAASDEAELARMVVTAQGYDAGPIAFRFPRGAGVGVEMDADPQPLEIGRGRMVKSGGRDLALLSFGTRLQVALEAAERLETQFGLSVSVADARFAKPLDEDLVRDLVHGHRALITLEEGARGGFGAQVLHFLSDADLLDARCKVKTLCLPDSYQNHASQDEQYAEAGLDVDAVLKVVADLKLDRAQPSLHIA